MDLNLCISNGTVSTKIYGKRDDFDFDIVNFPFLDGDVPRRTSYGVYISQLIRFARASSNLNDFNGYLGLPKSNVYRKSTGIQYLNTEIQL